MELLEVPVASASFQGGKPSRPLLPSARAPPPRDPTSLAVGLCFPCFLCFEQEDETRPDPCLALVLAGSPSHRQIPSSPPPTCRRWSPPCQVPRRAASRFVDQASSALNTINRSNQPNPLGPAGSLKPVWPDPSQPAPNPLPVFSRSVRPRVSALMLSIALDEIFLSCACSCAAQFIPDPAHRMFFSCLRIYLLFQRTQFSRKPPRLHAFNNSPTVHRFKISYI